MVFKIVILHTEIKGHRPQRKLISQFIYYSVIYYFFRNRYPYIKHPYRVLQEWWNLAKWQMHFVQKSGKD